MSRSRARDEHGGSAVEYGLLVSSIAAVIAVAVYAFGGVVRDVAHHNCTHITTTTAVTSSTCK